MSQVLQVKELSSGYGKVTVLRDINFQIEENEVVAIIGSNGAGKTTLLKTISKLISPFAGEIIFEGQNITKYPPHLISRAGIAHVPEGGKLFINMSVYENLLMGTYRNRKKIKNNILKEIYEIFPILKKRDCRILHDSSYTARPAVIMKHPIIKNLVLLFQTVLLLAFHLNNKAILDFF